MFNLLQTKENQKKYNCIPNEETSKYFQSCYLCIKDFFVYIYNNPKIMFQIIKNIEKSKFDIHFAKFICNNFYEDILNPDKFSNNFLYLIDLLLNDFVNDSSSPSDFIKKFNESNISIILECLSFNKEIKNYFHQILSKILEKYYFSDDYNKLLLFDVEEINNYIINQEEKFKMVIKNSSSKVQREIAKKQKNQINAAIASTFMMRLFNDNNDSSETTLIEYEMEIISHKSKENINENQLFSAKYLPELTKNDLLELYQNDVNEIFREYIKCQLMLFDSNNNDKNLFSNNILLEKIQLLKESEKILFYYQRNFMTMIDLINKIINELLLQIDIMPNCIIYICKKIYAKLILKFSKITKYEIYNCISEFFFNTLLKTFLLSPDYKTHITRIIQNKNLEKNLKTLVQIISKLTTGNFYISYNDPNFTPFNLYFIEKYKSICDIYEKILYVNLPEYTNLQNNNSKLYSYSMLYTVEFLTRILNIIKHNKEKFFDETDINNEFYIIYNKFYDNKDLLKSLKEKDISSINCYIFFNIVFPDNLKNIIDIELRNPSFKIDEIENQNNETENNLNSAQNLLSELLFNLPNLDIIKQKITKVNNTKYIFEYFIYYYREINAIFFKNESKEEDKIPPEWYINSLLNLLDNLNSDFTENEYEKFFSLFKKNIIKSINSYKFEELIKIKDFFNNMIKCKQEFISNQKIYQEILLNSQINKFIENELIEVEIKLEYSDIMKYFLITSKDFSLNENNQIVIKRTITNNKKSKSNRYSRAISTVSYNNFISINAFTILDFTKKFPDLIEVQNNSNKVNIFILEKSLHIEESLYLYFDIIKLKIPKKFQQYPNNYDLILKKIQKIIFEKIYDKIYSKNYDEDDYSLYQKTNSLILIIKKSDLELFDFDYNSVLPSINELFKKIDYEKSPHGKIEIITQIFEIIINIVKFSLGEDYNEVDLIKVCKYMIINANPARLWSNMKYLEMFKDTFIDNENSEKYLEILIKSMIEIMKMDLTDNIEIA